MPISLRPGGIDDAEAIERVRIATWRRAYAGLMPQDFLDGLRVDPESVTRRWRRLRDRDVGCVVAEEDGAIIGFATYGPSRDPDIEGGELYAIYVLPDYWSSGVGLRLIAAAANGLKEYKRWGLWVLETNDRARKFYEVYGLRDSGHRKPLKGVGVAGGLVEVHYEYVT